MEQSAKKTLSLKRVILSCVLEEDLELRDNLHGASQGFIYNIITNGDERQAKDVHDREQRKEFTFRPLYFDSYFSDRKHPGIKYIKKGTKATLEIIAHTEEFLRLFLQGSFEQKAKGSFCKFMNHNVIIIETKLIAGLSAVGLYEKNGSPERVLLDFKTPVWFRLLHPKSNLELKGQGYKLKEKLVRFPDPVLLYRTLRDQIANYAGYEDWIPSFEEFIGSVFVDKIINGRSMTEKTKRDEKSFEYHEGFVGKLLYFIDGTPELRNKIFNFLRLGSYFGAGARTSLGFGQFEVEAKPFTSLVPPTGDAVDLVGQDLLSDHISE